MLALQRLAGNRAVTSTATAAAGPLPVQRWFWNKKKKPTEAEQLEQGRRSLTDANSQSELDALWPYAAQIQALAARGAIVAELDQKLKGPDRLVRESLKAAVLQSSLDIESLKEKIGTLGELTSPLDPARTEQVKQVVAKLAKGAKKSQVATYHALYARCMQASSTMHAEHGDPRDFAPTGEAQGGVAPKDLVRSIRAVSRISAMTFDVSYSEALMRQREDAVSQAKAQNGRALEVTVIGAGPVGMMAALEAALAGATVNVYEMRRTGPSRSNVLKLTDGTIQKLRRLGVYGDIFGPDAPKGDDSVQGSHGVSVAYLEDVLRARAAQIGIRVTYGYTLEEITAPGQGETQTSVRLKKYVPKARPGATKPSPEEEMYKSAKDNAEVIDARSDLVIGATGAGGQTRQKLGLGSNLRTGAKGEEYIDFVAVGLFNPDRLKKDIPGADKSRDNAWMVGLRTPAVDYLLAQITRSQFTRFRKDEGVRNTFIKDRGKTVAGFEGDFRSGSVFDITINQAKDFVDKTRAGVVIGDEAATPHPLTGSGFNTGASTTDLVGGLVRGVGGAGREQAFDAYSQGTKKRTDAMVDKGSKFFEKNIDKLTRQNAPEPEPEPEPQGEVEDSPPQGGGLQHYTLEDIGVVTELDHQRLAEIQARVDALFGISHGNYDEDEKSK